MRKLPDVINLTPLDSLNPKWVNAFDPAVSNLGIFFLGFGVGCHLVHNPSADAPVNRPMAKQGLMKAKYLDPTRPAL
ncbi:hypothetical protein Acr_00g0001410 [Actinidia rufa]|uniref:Uncharacterized protein n=1 Tax=Actinidia rufa TaxID=165716 RepID=A0A7J0D6J6_9ERIC|nr:hypothetical protein Acr_00g0001410 [Actinidia rufa]